MKWFHILLVHFQKIFWVLIHTGSNLTNSVQVVEKAIQGKCVHRVFGSHRAWCERRLWWGRFGCFASQALPSSSSSLAVFLSSFAAKALSSSSSSTLNLWQHNVIHCVVISFITLATTELSPGTGKVKRIYYVSVWVKKSIKVKIKAIKLQRVDLRICQPGNNTRRRIIDLKRHIQKALWQHQLVVQ